MRNLFDDQTRALLQVGLIKPIDLVFLIALAILGCGTASIWIFGQITTIHALVAIGISCLVLLTWVVVLVYRCCYHVVMARSEINTMPEAAAKLAISYQIGER